MSAFKTLWKSAGLLAIALASACAGAQEFKPTSAAVEFATGNATQMLRVGVQSDWNQDWAASGGMHWNGYWDVTAAYWRGNRYQNVKGRTQSFGDIGFTPVFRYEAQNKKGWYAEAAVGLHYLGERYDNFGRQMSTKFEFGDHIGAGYVFDNGLELAMKIQHFSNGGIKHPNGGVNFVEAKAAFHF
ncbi:acyloxyacyl hydrolase [Massilia sp. TS11]|uniref:acyloxyacyl hydrolase n=1 Tax=Massilia sp. TS11 TaxID=2908003 RepID=UPI001EDBD32E|nr:acyloxyacyl hydrolase [Massilia sp. TS11]MCG2586880.1 acyloxyacyl hydrolase [Massilia sp. TS11]